MIKVRQIFDVLIHLRKEEREMVKLGRVAVFILMCVFLLTIGNAAAQGLNYPQRQVTAQDLYFGWGKKKENGLSYYGQKGNMFGFLRKETQAIVVAKFVNGNWVEGSTLIPETALINPDSITRSMISIHYLCAMASIGQFTPALLMVDDFVNKALSPRSTEVGNAYIKCVKVRQQAANGVRLLLFEFRFH